MYDSQNLLKSKLQYFGLKLTTKSNGREAVDLLIRINELHLQSIDLDTASHNINISKQSFVN